MSFISTVTLIGQISLFLRLEQKEALKSRFLITLLLLKAKQTGAGRGFQFTLQANVALVTHSVGLVLDAHTLRRVGLCFVLGVASLYPRSSRSVATRATPLGAFV